jgi:hypothetical protein
MALKDVDLNRLSEEELIELNHKIIQHLGFIRETRSRHHILKFNIGDVVSFSPEPGRIVSGTIVRLNQKTVSMVTKEGCHWRVSPSYLSSQKTTQQHENQSKTSSSLRLIKPQQQVSRNAPCPCGSGKKYKRCCLLQQ